MDLAGQGASASPGPGRSSSDDRGYILAVLLIGMAVAAVWMSAALPAWRQQVTRQRELDLIFRGEQYARAVALYVMKNNCALPTNVDQLVSQRFLRKKWKDPITNDDFVLLPGVAPGGASGGGQPITGGPSRAGGGATGGAPATQGRGPAGGAPTTSTPSTSGRGPSSTGPGASGPSTSPGGLSTSSGSLPGGIGGVSSKSTATSIIVYNGQQTYNGWQFLYQNALQKMGEQPRCGNQGAPGGPGAPGRSGDGRGGPGGVGPRGGGPGAPPPPGRGDGRGDGRGRGGAPAGAPIGRIGRGGF